MKKNYFLTLLITLFITSIGYTQTTVFSESFETGNSGTASETCNDNGGDFFTRTNGTDITSSYTVSGADGDYFFAAMDTDGSPCTSALQTLFFDDINISSKTDLTLALLLAEDQPSDGKFDWDGGDLFYIEVDYDNSGTFTKVLQFATSATTGFNVSAPLQDTDFDGIGDGQALIDVFSEFTLSLGTGNLVDIRLVFDGLNNGDEDIAVDNIRVIDGFVAEPSLAITAPSNNTVYPSTTTDIPVLLSVSNFTLSGDNGSEESDNTGDGYILGILSENGVAEGSKKIFSTSQNIDNVEPGIIYVITAELVDNTGASLSPKVEATVTFSVELPCDLVLEDAVTTCDALTAGVDTYNGSIAFTGGDTGVVYIITADGATIAGDDPSSAASGTITFTGITEGSDISVTIVGDAASSCDFSRTIYGPTCISFPIIEDFNYSDGSLTDNPLWTGFSGTSGDLMVSSGKALVQHGTPSEDAQTQFAPVSGSIYYALDFTVINPGNVISGTDNEYFAIFKDSGSGFAAQLDIVPPATTGDFSVGIASGSSSADSVWATDLSYGVAYRATVKYDQDANIAQLWINASLESDTSILGADLDGSGKSIVSFALRQSDSNLNEGILVDNLRIGTTFSDTSLSIRKTEIEGFTTYPNPVTNNRFTITSSNSDKKEVIIFNVLGKKVFSSTFTGLKKELNVSTINSGIYILKVTEDGKTATKKLVIR